jgi:hypothetical protein
MKSIDCGLVKETAIVATWIGTKAVVLEIRRNEKALNTFIVQCEISKLLMMLFETTIILDVVIHVF